MPKFKCNDVDCKCYGHTELIPHVRFKFNTETNKLEADEAECKGCGNQRDVVKEGKLTEMPWFKAENSRNYQNKTIKRY